MSETTLLDAIRDLECVYCLESCYKSECDKFFASMDIGDYIRPGDLKSIINVDIKTAYRFMEDVKNRGFVTNIYEVHCSCCDKSMFLNSLSDFNRGLVCDKKVDLFNDVIVLYRVVKI